MKRGDMRIEEILNTRMIDNDAEAETIRDYLKELMLCLWHDKANFNSKKPFGDLGWEHCIGESLAVAGLVKGKIVQEKSGRKLVYSYDFEARNELIDECIKYVFRKE